MKQEKFIQVKMKEKWVKVSIDAIEQSLQVLYERTKVKELDVALMKARSYYKADERFMQEVGFLSKLLQLEASGYLVPPVNFVQLYREVALKLSNRASLKPEIE